jgi:putative redox protein
MDAIAQISTKTASENYKTELKTEHHTVWSDEPEDKGGKNIGMEPLELLLGSLGACTNITLKMYANRKGWDLEAVEIQLQLFQENGITSIERKIKLIGNLDDTQKQRCLQIANACPVHKILIQSSQINSSLID